MPLPDVNFIALLSPFPATLIGFGVASIVFAFRAFFAESRFLNTLIALYFAVVMGTGATAISLIAFSRLVAAITNAPVGIDYTKNLWPMVAIFLTHAIVMVGLVVKKIRADARLG